MTIDRPFEVVMSRLSDGDGDAAEEIFQKYVHRLIGLASAQVEARYRSKVDPEEVVQSVYKSFFQRQRIKPFKLDDWDGLWAVLASITVHKCIDRRDYWIAGCRNVHLEVDLATDSPTNAWQRLVTREPTVEQATLLAETVERVLSRLKPFDRRIAELLLQGYTAREIDKSGVCSERTVGRVASKIRGIFDEIIADEQTN